MPLTVHVGEGPPGPEQTARLEALIRRREPLTPLSWHPGWLHVLHRALGYPVYCLELGNREQAHGYLPLAFVNSILFGRFLVSLPYLNYGGVLADDDLGAGRLLDEAVALADKLKVRYLEVRHQHRLEHPALGENRTDKVHMRLDLPATPAQLLGQFSSKLRSQVNKARKNGLTVEWGTNNLLPDFYAVFSRNMRDLGTPVYGRALFRHILDQFPDRAEIGVIRLNQQPVAAGLLLHGWGVSEVPSASSLRQYNHTAANMLLYWHLLERAVQRGQAIFDFGRSSQDSGTFRFKQQWGATPAPAAWQYYVRTGRPNTLRPDNPRLHRLIALWQRLPLWLTRLVGPRIVRGIP